MNVYADVWLAMRQAALPQAGDRISVAHGPNSWADGTRTRFVASVGVETFDVRAVVSLATGKIISAGLDNPVQVLERECSDSGLTMCGAPMRYEIVRRVAIAETS